MLRDTKNGGRPINDGREPARPSAEQAHAAGGIVVPTSPKAWSRLIADAVTDQNGHPWVKIGDAERGRWFAVAGMVGDTRELFRDLAQAGLAILLKPDQTMLLKAVQHHRRYRHGLVATRPGWLATPDGTRLYVHGGGTATQPRGSQPVEVIVAFKPMAKFTPRGDISAWRDATGPVVGEQTLPMFVLGYGLVPPLLELAPPDCNNQVLELKGPTGSGKSVLSLLAASLWAGDPGRETLGGEDWLTTLEYTEDYMRDHADSLLVLDETNKAATDARSQGELVKKAVFRLSGTEGKGAARHRRRGHSGAPDDAHQQQRRLR